MGLFENLKARFLKSIITWSEMGQQTVQAKEVYKPSKLKRFIVLVPECVSAVNPQITIPIVHSALKTKQSF